MKFSLIIIGLIAFFRVSEGGTVNTCLGCQQEVEALRSSLPDLLTQDTVSRFLEAFCDRFHKNEKQDCIRSFGSKARPFLKQIKHTKAEGICAYIGQCPDDPRQSPLFDVDAVTWNVTSDSDTELRGMLCTVCTTTMNFIHTFLSDKSFQKTIIRMLSVLCQITGPLKRMCLSFLHRYGPLVIELAEKELTPELCKTLNLCITSNTSQTQATSAGFLCSVCKDVTDTIHFLVMDKDNERRVIAIAKYLCNKLPSLFRNMCDEFIAIVLPSVFDYLRSNCQLIDNFCKIIRFCQSDHTLIKTEVASQRKMEKESQALMFVAKRKMKRRLSFILA